jgi:WD40 repeat protein
MARPAILAASRGAAGAVSTEVVMLAAEGLSGVSRAKLVGAVLLLAAAVTVGLAAGMYSRAEPAVRPEAVGEAETPPAERARPGGPIPLRILTGDNLSGLSGLALSPDGRMLAAVGNRGLVTLWDVKTGEVRHTLRQEGVYAVTFSPDGKTLASGASGVLSRTAKGDLKIAGEVKLWDVATGKEKATLEGHVAFVYTVAWSPDGQYLASAGGASPASTDTNIRWSFEGIPKGEAYSREFGELKVWDLATEKDRTFFCGGDGRIMSVAFSPDSKTLATGGWDGAVRLWEAATGRERARFAQPGQSVHSVAFSPDGKTLASVQVPELRFASVDQTRAALRAGQEERVKLWDLATGKVRTRLTGHAGWVASVAFSSDGQIVATAGNVPPRDPAKAGDPRGEVRLWDATTGAPRDAPLTFPHHANRVAFSVRGAILAEGGPRENSGPGEVTLWDLRPRRGLRP